MTHVINTNEPDFQQWNGLRVSVKEEFSRRGESYVSLTPMDDRPDGHGKTVFLWPASQIQEEVVAKDFMGKPIRKGDTVVYPNRSGSSMWMIKAEVLDILVKTNWRGEPQYGLRVKATGERFNSQTRSYEDYQYTRPVWSIGRVVVVS